MEKGGIDLAKKVLKTLEEKESNFKSTLSRQFIFKEKKRDNRKRNL